jgi:hypothetical protein
LGSGGSFAPLTTVLSGASGFTVSGLIPDAPYSFEVTPVYMAATGGALSEGAAAGPVSAQTKPGLPPASLTANVIYSYGGAYIVGTSVQNASGAVAPTDEPNALGPTGRVADVQLSWPAVSEAAGYQVSRDGTQLMQPTSPVTGTGYTDAGVPPGDHTYSVASIFKTTDHGFVEGQLTQLPSVKVAVAFGFYRLVLEQVIVNQATTDTPLSTDGRGDEIYVTADVDWMPSARSFGAIRSWTYGDIYQHGDRISAGSLTLKGGIQKDDTLPERAGPCTTTDTNHLCIPIEVFRGPLLKGEGAVYTTPRIWEWDGLSDLFPPAFATRHQQGVELLQVDAQLARAMAAVVALKKQLQTLTPAGGGVVSPIPSASAAQATALSPQLQALTTGGATGASAAQQELARQQVAKALQQAQQELQLLEERQIELIEAMKKAAPPSSGFAFDRTPPCPAVPWCGPLSALLPGISPLLVTGLQTISQDRPIGIRAAALDVLKGQGYYQYDDVVIPLSYDVAEGLASGKLGSAGLGTGEFTITFTDKDGVVEKGGGSYTLKFVVQRCTSMAQC